LDGSNESSGTTAKTTDMATGTCSARNQRHNELFRMRPMDPNMRALLKTVVAAMARENRY
jgi:hypothetical protein